MLNKLVTDLIDKKYDDNEQETSTTKTEVFAIASRSKTEANPTRFSTACSSSRTVLVLERIWIVELGAQSKLACPVSKRLSTLLRHGDLLREEDDAIEFWRPKDDLWNDFVRSQHWSDEMWKGTMAKGGGNKKRFQYCTDPTGQEILYLRALQGHLLILHYVLIPNNFFEYIYHIGCAVHLHSITNSGLIAGGQNSSRDRQTVFFTAVNPMHKNHQDPKELDLTKPRLASCKKVESASTHVCWVDIQLA